MFVARNFTAIITTLRYLMIQHNLTAYIIPSEDAHYTEFIADCHQRRAYISGFTGSAGTAIVTVANNISEERALLWTDGRYYLQAAKELPAFWTLMEDEYTDSQSTWLKENIPNGTRVGVDPSLYSIWEWNYMKTELNSAGIILEGVNTNLVDRVWTDQPSCWAHPVFNQEIEFSGKHSREKVADMRQEMKDNEATVLIVTELDEVAWLLNLRGRDIPYSATFYAYVIVTDEQFHVFIDEMQLREKEMSTLKQNIPEIQIHKYDSVFNKLREIVTTLSGKVWYSIFTNYALVSVLEEELVPDSQQVVKMSPIALMKARKNPTEVSGFKKALIRDSAAICSFLAWLEMEVKEGTVTELSAAAKLHSIRMEQDNFVDDSFPATSAAGGNAAIIHYTPTSDSDRKLTTTDVYLLDSGGLYRDGTTDITRAIHLGGPTEYQKDCYTRVLKGQIALTRAIFPDKEYGSNLDAFARQFLWEVGLDYNHGTGHGVGSFLNVHEGPSGIGPGIYPEDPGLQENFFTSNEPGYYDEKNAFGIRLENIIRVKSISSKYKFHNSGYLGFEDVTFVPYDHNLIDFSLLTEDELDYINDYQIKIRYHVGNYMREKNMSAEALGWMTRATVPLGKHEPIINSTTVSTTAVDPTTGKLIYVTTNQIH